VDPFRRGVADDLEIPEIDEALGDRAARQLRLDLSRGNWEPARDFLIKVERFDERAFYAQIAAQVDGLENWIGEWLAAEPWSTLPLLIRGGHAVHRAWRLRGAARSRQGTDRFDEFFEHLKLAEDCLQEVAERFADDPTAWMYLVLTGRAREVGVEETERRFRQVIVRDPWHRVAHEHMLQQLSPRWGGSAEAMHEFARRTVAEMPPGTPLGHLVAVAHIEQWLETPDGQETAYIRSPAVVADLRAAAETSIWHPNYTRWPGWPTVHNPFAMAFWLAGDWPAAADQFEAIGDLVTEWPWRHLGDPGRRFALARQETGRRLARSGTPPPAR